MKLFFWIQTLLPDSGLTKEGPLCGASPLGLPLEISAGSGSFYANHFEHLSCFSLT